jgi:uncharacterized protein (DUF1697 family)
MPGFALALRGINVGGNHKLPMADLRALLEDLGFTGVQTVLQSGNAVFRTAAKPAAALERKIQTAVGKAFGFEPDCLVRTAAEWHALKTANPFPSDARRDPAHLLVVLLHASAGAKHVAALREDIRGRESVELVGRQLYAVYPDGIGNSKLTLPLIEKHLGTRGTGRNWNTVIKVGELLGD